MRLSAELRPDLASPRPDPLGELDPSSCRGKSEKGKERVGNSREGGRGRKGFEGRGRVRGRVEGVEGEGGW